MKILITGGTGTIGLALAKSHVIAYFNEHGSPYSQHSITIFSRNESDQVTMKSDHPYFSYVVGDVRDYSEVFKACEGMDYVFHLAALKHINICEEKPQEAVKTNVLGTMNLINACREHGAQLISMSTDKAINPTSVYGITKFLAEEMVTQAGFLSVRSGNVLWSSGSVFPIWEKQLKETNVINITSKNMTRFFISVDEVVRFLWSNRDQQGVLTVSMQSFNLNDIAEEFIKRFGDDDSSINVMGLRPGEREHEYRDKVTSSDEHISTNLNYIFDGKI